MRVQASIEIERAWCDCPVDHACNCPDVYLRVVGEADITETREELLVGPIKITEVDGPEELAESIYDTGDLSQRECADLEDALCVSAERQLEANARSEGLLGLIRAIGAAGMRGARK